MNYSDRLRRFQELLGNAADVAFFPISADLEYLTGVPRDIPNFGWTMHPGAWLEGLWITPTHEPVLTLPHMTARFGGYDDISNLQLRVLGDWDDPSALVRDILKGFNLPQKARIAVGDRTHGETLIALQAIYPEVVFHSATELLRSMRVVKSEDEIAVMRRAGEITEAAFADVLKQLRIGMTELEVVSEVDYQLRRHGSLGPSFTTSLYNSGPNHPLLMGNRVDTWPRQLTAPVSVLFDFGGVLDGYCYDFGRTVSFGAPEPELVKVHSLIMQAQAEGIKALKAGEVTTTQVDAAARQVLIDAGYGAEFRHRLGHAIGMDVHEPPYCLAILESGANDHCNSSK